MVAIGNTLRSGRWWRSMRSMMILFYIYHCKRFAWKGRWRKRCRRSIERHKHIFAWWCNRPRGQRGGKGMSLLFRKIARLFLLMLIVSMAMLLWMKHGRLNRGDVFYYVFIVSSVFICFWNKTMFFVLVITEWSDKHLTMVFFTVIGSFVSTITTQLL